MYLHRVNLYIIIMFGFKNQKNFRADFILTVAVSNEGRLEEKSLRPVGEETLVK